MTLIQGYNGSCATSQIQAFLLFGDSLPTTVPPSLEIRIDSRCLELLHHTEQEFVKDTDRNLSGLAGMWTLAKTIDRF